MITLTSGSAPAARNASESASIRSWDSAFSAFGRFIVRRRTGPMSSVRTSGSFAAASVMGSPSLVGRFRVGPVFGHGRASYRLGSRSRQRTISSTCIAARTPDRSAPSMVP